MQGEVEAGSGGAGLSSDTWKVGWILIELGRVNKTVDGFIIHLLGKGPMGLKNGCLRFIKAFFAFLRKRSIESSLPLIT